jgi:hypothetical protein
MTATTARREQTALPHFAQCDSAALELRNAAGRRERIGSSVASA